MKKKAKKKNPSIQAAFKKFGETTVEAFQRLNRRLDDMERQQLIDRNEPPPNMLEENLKFHGELYNLIIPHYEALLKYVEMISHVPNDPHAESAGQMLKNAPITKDFFKMGKSARMTYLHNVIEIRKQDGRDKGKELF